MYDIILNSPHISLLSATKIISYPVIAAKNTEKEKSK